MPRDQRSVREHFNKLVSEFKTKMRTEENSTGTSPAPLTEKETLLEEIVELMDSQPKEEKRQDSERQKALNVRDQAMKTWSKSRKHSDDSDKDEDSNNETTRGKSVKKRKTRLQANDAFKYLEARSAQEAAIRKEELQIQKEKRELDEQKIQLEQAKFEQVKEQMQQQQQQILMQQQMQADYQKQQLKMQEQLLQQQIQSQNIMIALLGKLSNKEQ